MALSSKEQVNARVMSGLDVEYLTTLNRLAAYAWGEKYSRYKGSVAEGGDWPDFRDLQAKRLEIGISRKVLNNQFISLSRVMYASPRPEFPDVDQWTSEIRKQFFLARWHGDGGVDSEWNGPCEMAFLDGDSLGVGWVQIGLASNPASGMQRVAVRHIPSWNVIYDPTVVDPVAARWICFKEFIPSEDAIAMYGEKAREHTTTMCDNLTTQPIEVVKCFTYYDLGIADREPTRAVILGQLSNDPITVERNPFGIIPAAPYVHLCLSGHRRPIGRISMQAASQELINRIEKYKRSIIEDGRPLDIVDLVGVDQEDVKRWKAGGMGLPIKRLKQSGKAEDLWRRIPGQEMPQTIASMQQDAERELIAESGVTDSDRGLESGGGARTATEISQIANRSAVQGSWSKRQAMMFYTRLVERAMRVAAAFDRDPVTLSIKGHAIPINDSSQPQSFISEFLKDRSSVLIDEADLTYTDEKQERMQRLGELNAVAPEVAAGLIDPVWYATEKLKAIGEKDPTGIVRHPPQAPPDGASAPGVQLPTGGQAPPPGPSQIPTPPQVPSPVA